MPEPLTLEVDDAAARVFGLGRAFDVTDLRARLRFAIESAVPGWIPCHASVAV